jgi:ABC-type dipeptide/oligopeptide/nickel transport system permease subunit
VSARLRVGGALLAALVLFAIVGPHLAPDRMLQGDLAHGILNGPSPEHWLGTDQLSRDLFARLAFGARITLAIAAIAVTVAGVLGSAIGLLAGASDGILAQGARRLINLGLALPRLIVLLVVLATLGTIPIVALGVVLGVTGWPAVARLVFGETRRLRRTAFVAAAEALGATPARIVWREILPGTLPAVLVATTLGVADAILLEAGLSFIGVGVRAPEASWGSMIFEAREQLARAPWLLIAPCVALGLATSAATLLGEALRQSLQPDTR